MAIHKKGFYLWALAAPLTAPISIIRETQSARNVLTPINYINSHYTQHSFFLLRVAVMVTL